MIMDYLNGEKQRYGRLSMMLAVLLITATFAFSVSPVAGAKEFIQPNSEFSTNYYDAYGEPDIYASILGDAEFERGETVQLRVVLSNRGVLHGIKADTHVGSNEALHQLSLQEIEYESMRTTALGIKVEAISGSDYVEVDPSTSVQTLDKLSPGVLPDSPMMFTITISDNAPAGVYDLVLPVTYEFQSEVEMTGGSAVRLGLPSLDHTTFYEVRNTTLHIPVIVEPAAKFVVTDVEGELTTGQAGSVNVTYTNVGELPANDAYARIVVMKPLSSTRSVVTMGDVLPGQSTTVSFNVAAEAGAVEKIYGIDSEIKYRNDNDEVEFSDNILVEVPVKARSGGIDIIFVAIAGIVLAIGYMGYTSLRKNNNKK